MPLYEYRCRECGQSTEFRSTMDKKESMAATLKCDACGSGNFSQVLGGVAFVQGSAGTKTPMPPSGGDCCSGGMCGL